jgi:hypothetical protein
MAEKGVSGTDPSPPPPLPSIPVAIPGGDSEREGPSMQGAGSDSAGASGSKDVCDDLEDRFEGMDLCRKEETDLDFLGEIEELIGEVRWLAIFKVHTSKSFSHAARSNRCAMHGR